LLQEIRLRVNGRTHTLTVEPDTPLLYILRNDLGLKAAKFACGLEQCGACQILVNGEAVPSCRLPVRSVQGREITTLEGLGTEDNLHALQAAFIEEQAVQCGFCTPGMIIRAKALLDRCPQPSDDQIRAEMSANLCRCGVYDRVLRAIKRAAGLPVASPAYGDGGLVEPEGQPAARVRIGQGALPHTLAQTPSLDAWVRINSDGTITLFTGKAELGQDIRTSIAMIGADELDVSLDRIRVVTADTAQSPDEGYTVSSMSLETSGNAIRYAAAEVRQIALSVAHEELEAPLERLTVSDGTITDTATGRSITYWDLFAGKSFGGKAGALAQPKAPGAYKIVGRATERLDLVPKVTGRPVFIQDLDLPGMVHGRVVRPPGYGARLISADEEGVRRMPGVLEVVRDGSFLAVIARREEQAVEAAQTLKGSATWEEGRSLPTHETLYDYLQRQPVEALLIVNGRPVDDPIPAIEAPAEAAQTLSATYYRPYHMHAALGPSAAVAQWIDGKLTVWSHSQGVYPLRRGLAQVLGMPEERIHAIHVPGPGCFGHNGADDAALDAALLARAQPGQPISLKWTRADEHAWEPYGAAMVIQMQASLNQEGDVIDWNHDMWGYSHLGRDRGGGASSGLLAAWYLAEPFERPQRQPSRAPQVGMHRNAEPLYSFPRRRIVEHFVADSPLRTSTLRGLGSYANVFALESFMDELAHAAGEDPVAYRLRHLKDARARAVIEAAANRAGSRPAGNGRGRGIAFAQYKNRQSYVAVVVDLSVNRNSGHIRLERAVVAADVGQIVNPDGLSNQLEGAVTQAASWTLKEQVAFDHQAVISRDWYSYPILRFREAPVIETVLLNRPGQPYLGVGEGANGPVPAAIANAVFDAVGIRLRRIPFTPDRVKGAF
jgi:CO/xanthine dehydrogenase Mo-binding subunit/aerobic-type carbon monoxide dehydrogenase small subunit (CoxS/CutS family)